MRHLEKRIIALETITPVRSIALDHVPDDALEEMERIAGKHILDYSRDDVLLLQSHGFMTEVTPGPGLLRDWFPPKEVAAFLEESAI
ncbi:MAG: hypothetical protein ABW184_09945 [Sphingobium sp.]